MKKRILMTLVVVFCLLILSAGYLFIGNPVVFWNNQRLGKAVQAVETETVTLNEAVPFAWDAVYTFEPYQDRESIEKVIGFASSDVKSNLYNEGMVHLLFVKGEKVTASVLGYRENLGYCIDFSPKMMITYEEQAKFSVEHTDGVTILTLTEG